MPAYVLLQADYLTLAGLSLERPMTTAFYGTHMQLSSIYSVLTSALIPVLQQANISLDLTSHAGRNTVQRALVYAMWSQDSSTNETGFSNSAIIQKVLAVAYNGTVADYGGQAVPGAMSQVVAASRRDMFWAAVAQVRRTPLE